MPLRNQSSDVLAELARNAGQTLSKDHLIETVWKDTFVTDDSLVQCIADIRRALGKDGHKIIQTFAKKGYRLYPTVPSTAPSDAPPIRSSRLAFATFFVALLAIGAYLTLGPRTSSTIPTPTIAVLPFDDFSTGADKGYLSDAIAEGIITELSRSRLYDVIARNSSFKFRDTATDVRTIGQDLGAHYILEGSQQKNGNKLKVTAQLIEASSQKHLWAHTYEREIGDLFVVQDEIIRTLAHRVGRKIENPLPITSTAKVSALHYSLMGIAAQRKDFSAAGLKRSSDLYLRAIDADPNATFGYIGLAFNHRHYAVYGWNGFTKETALTLAEKYADKAIELAPDDPWAHYARARVHVERVQLDQANARFSKAIELFPHNPDFLVRSSSPLLYVGRTDEAIERIKRAMGIDPYHKDWFHWQMGWALWQKGQCDDALKSMRRMKTINPAAHKMLSAIHAFLGQIDQAKQALAVFLERSSIATLRKERDNSQDLWTAPGALDRWVDHLRLAGLPE